MIASIRVNLITNLVKFYLKYFSNRDIEIVRRSTILAGSVSGDRILPIQLNQNAVVDIDNLEDLKKVELKLKDNE